jgi:hypothetical protein
MKWKIFIMCHNCILDDMYSGDKDFSSQNYSFFKLGPSDLDFSENREYHIINEFDLPIHIRNAHYAELTGLYAIYKNGLYKDLDFIGFSHYDKEHRLIGVSPDTNIDKLESTRLQVEKSHKANGRTDITYRIENCLQENPHGVHIILEAHEFNKIYSQKVMMDKDDPDGFVGDGVNCFDAILDDYNSHFGTSFTISDVAADGYLTMCDCFVTSISLFEKLMKFLVPIIESRRLDIFDSKRQHRLQGGLLERYVAVFFALEKIKKIEMSTFHQYWRKKKVSRFKAFIKSLGMA